MKGTPATIENVATQLFPGVVDLGKHLPRTQGGLIQLVSRTRHAVTYSDPVIRERVQAELDQTVGLVVCAHWIHLFNQALPTEYWSWFLEDHDRRRLRAYRHVANGAVEGLGHGRSKRDRRQFDAVMRSGEPLRGVVVDGETITVSLDVAYELGRFLEEVHNKLIVRLHKEGGL